MTQPPENPQQWWQPPATSPSGQGQQPSNGPYGHGQQPGQGQNPVQWQQNQHPESLVQGGWQHQPSGTPSGGLPAQSPWQPGHPSPQSPSTPPHGQPGGGFQPAQYGGLGAFGQDAKPARKRSKKPLLIGGIIVVVLAGGGAAAWLLGAFTGDTLEQKSLQDNVSKILREAYGENDVQQTQCPDDAQVETGVTFDCSVQVGGAPKKVTVRVLNDKPEYEVGAPH